MYDEVVVAADINFVVKNNGVVVQIVSDGVVRVFKNVVLDTNVIEIQDKGILSRMRLFTDGDTVFIADKDKLMTFEMVK